MYSYNDIKMVHLEVTQRCQAACPMCDRNENGGRDNRHITNAELTLDDAKAIFEPKFIQQLNTMYMCGNLGDPIVARDTLEIFEYFRQHNPKIWLSMNTNGGAKDPDWWRELARVYGRMGAVIFSLDGLEDTNHMYRQNVRWDIVERSFTSFIDAGGRARWDYIIFDYNEHQVEDAEGMAMAWGFEKFRAKKTGRFFSTAKNTGKETHQAQNRKGEDTATLAKPKNEAYQNKALAKEEEIKNQFGSMMDYYDSCKIKCKVAEEKNIYITAEGLLLPCCWTAGRMYKWWQLDPKVEQIWDHIDGVGGKDVIDCKVHGLETVFESGILGSIKNSWNKDSIKSGKLGVCAQKCGDKFDAFAEQFA